MTRLDGTISGVNEVVGTFVWAEEVGELSELLPGSFDVSRLGFSHQVFELGEDLLDGVKVWARTFST
jgi:hypothetical protein